MRRKTVFTLMTSLAVLGMVWMSALSRGAPTSRVSLPASSGLHVQNRTPGAEAASGSVPEASTESVARLTAVAIRPEDGEKGIHIDLSTSQPVPYQVLHLTDPERLVLDLDGARNATGQWKYSADSPLLLRVRLGRFSEKDGGVIRVVADLAGNPAVKVRKEPTGFRIDLKPSEDAPDIQSPARVFAGRKTGGTPAAARPMVAAGSRLPRSQARAAIGKNDSPVKHVTVAPTGAAAAPVVRQKALLASENFGKNIAISTSQLRSGAPTAAPASQSAQVAASAAAPHPAASAPQPASNVGSGTEPQYTGERISLNLKDVDLKDFFRLIHEISGLNIIVDPNVSGSVTTVLDNVPWDQALDIVLKDNGLGRQLDGNVLRIAKKSTLMAEQDEDRKLEASKEESEPLVTVFRPLNYAKATTMATLLKSWVGGGALSRRGNVLVDDRTNTLIISDIRPQIPIIESVVDKLDQKAQQVSIEARIIRATSDFARNLGVALSYAQNNGSGSLITGGATGVNVSARPLSPPPITTGTATGFGVFVLSNLGRNYAINAAIAAAESRDEAKTISRPSIVTQNNVQGSVVQGTQIPIQTTINNTISVQYVQASLQLQVTPQVTQDGHVFLTIEIQNSSPGPALTLAGPTINTQSATTEVLVPDGGTVVFGGVTVTTRSKSSTGVPLLGTIPILGHLFKNSTVQNNDQELLFFVTPKVLPT